METLNWTERDFGKMNVLVKTMPAQLYVHNLLRPQHHRVVKLLQFTYR